MKIQDWFENYGIKQLSINLGFAKFDWVPQPEEQEAAWELYIEIISRVITSGVLDRS